MKRYPLVIGATAAGLAGILSFHSRSSSHALSNTLGIEAQAAAQGGARAIPTTTAPRHSAVTGSTATSVRPPALAPRSAVGASEQYGYGILSVRVTTSGGKITDVRLANLQTADSYSQQIAAQVIPSLRRQVLADQSARIDGISGATYTSEAYAQSVQSALDRLRRG
jgi:uncharacterized protein with FMN-binding domain